jgi:hypothetical protein
MDNAVILDELEDAAQGDSLVGDVGLIEAKANVAVVQDQESLDRAMDLLKQVKGMAKRVDEFFGPFEAAAKKTLDEIRGRKKVLKSPLQAAETVIKGKIGDYQIELDRQRKRLEEEAQRAAAAAAERSMDEAVAAEESGDLGAAEYALVEAEMAEDAALHMTVEGVKAKSSGLTLSKDYEIVSIDESKLPLYVDGVQMWKTPWEANIKRLIKMKNGNVEIPGVVFKETYSSRVRI